MRRRAVDQPEGHARVRRVQERALALDPEQLSAARGALDDELLGGAGDEVGDDRVDGDPPAGDRDPGLPGRDEDRSHPAPLRLAVELERDGHLPDRAVGADREDDPSPAVRGSRRSGRSARRAACAGRAARPRARAASATSSGSSSRYSCSPFSTSRPGGDALPQQLAPRRREAAARRGDADERRRRLESRAPPRPCRRSGCPS